MRLFTRDPVFRPRRPRHRQGSPLRRAGVRPAGGREVPGWRQGQGGINTSLRVPPLQSFLSLSLSLSLSLFILFSLSRRQIEKRSNELFNHDATHTSWWLPPFHPTARRDRTVIHRTDGTDNIIRRTTIYEPCVSVHVQGRRLPHAQV